MAPDRRPPGWLDLVVRSVAFAIVALGLVGLPLALLGGLRPLPTLLGSALVFGLLWLLWSRGGDRPAPGPVSRTTTVVALLAVAVALVSGVVNAQSHSVHLLVDGDPAVYAVTGALLARNGELTVPTNADTLFAGNEEINFAGGGFFPTEGEDSVYPQFVHLLPVLLAVAYWAGGIDLLLMANPILGAFSLLAFFSFAARVVRPVWALLAMGALGLLLPQVHFARDVFSEIPSQLLVFAGLALLWDVTGARHRGFAGLAGGLVAGLVLGGTVMARLDAALYVVPVAIGLMLLRAGRTGLAVVAGFFVSAALAIADGYFGSPLYLGSLAGPLRQIAVAMGLLGVVALGLRVVGEPSWIPRVGRALAVPAAVLTVALAAFAWFVRPLVQVTRKIPDRTNKAISRLQEQEGMPVDVPRSYDELSMQWLSWYLGPVALTLGVLGLAFLAYRVLRGRDLRLAPFVLLVGMVTAVYIWHPGIFPVHYWASRRFLPVSFPGLLLLAVLVADRVWAWGRRRDAVALRVGGPSAAAVGAAAVVLFPAAILPGAPLAPGSAELQAGFARMCDLLEEDDVVLLVGGAPATNGLVQAVPGYCGAPAGSLSRDAGPADLREVAEAVHARGRRLVLLSSVPETDQLPAGVELEQVFDVTIPTTALSLTKRPDAIFPYRIRLFSAVLPPE